MKNKLARDTRICTNKLADGRTEIIVNMKQPGRDFTGETEIRTGLTVGPDEVEKTCREIAEQFRRSGDRVDAAQIRR